MPRARQDAPRSRSGCRDGHRFSPRLCRSTTSVGSSAAGGRERAPRTPSTEGGESKMRQPARCLERALVSRTPRLDYRPDGMSKRAVLRLNKRVRRIRRHHVRSHRRRRFREEDAPRLRAGGPQPVPYVQNDPTNATDRAGWPNLPLPNRDPLKTLQLGGVRPTP